MISDSGRIRWRCEDDADRMVVVIKSVEGEEKMDVRPLGELTIRMGS